MRIEIRKNMVYLFNPGATSPIDYFTKSDIGRLLEGTKVSEYIFLLSRKSWMDKYTLYKLAQIIQRQFPKNNIDWWETFYPIEKEKLLNSLFKELQGSSLNKEQEKRSFSENLKLKLQLGIEIEKEGKDLILDKLKVNLKYYNLN